MGLYYEQTASLSAGTVWRSLSFSLETQAYRMGLTRRVPDAAAGVTALPAAAQSPRSRASASAGATLHLQIRRLSAGVTAEGLTVLASGDPAAADPAPSITARVCTARSRHGSQGAAMVITPQADSPLRFIIAQEYRIGGTFALSASIASNPTTIGFGLTADKFPLTGAAAVVNHPFLGWSRGVSADYAR
jgi:hypothetical protein